MVLLTMIWGSSFVFLRASVNQFGAIFLAILRIEIAVLFLLWLIVPRHNWQEFTKNWRILTLVGVFNSAIPFTCFSYASIAVNSGVLAIINSTTPIFPELIAHLWLNDKLSFYQAMGFLIAVLGTVVLVWEKLDAPENVCWSMFFALLA